MPSSIARNMFGSTAVAVVSSLLLAACGGGTDLATTATPAAPGGASAPAGSGAASAPPVVATTLGGTVAVGTAMSQGKLRILDADGTVVVSGVAIDDTGHYSGVTLTGPAPYRLEACGYAGGNYQCQYSVTSGPGTANVTPLTTATVLLASAQQPGELMTGTAASLTADTVAAAQTQLRTSLASLLTSAGVAADIDFTSATLDAGSRAGYDGLLDSVGVSTGTDGSAFVQIVPRLGNGNLYLQQGTTTGTVTATASAASLKLSTLDALFADLTTAIASAGACSDSTHGLAASMAPQARLGLDGGAEVTGGAQVAAGLCQMFAGEGDDSSRWGSSFVNPTLGRCDTSGAAPVCAVSFALQAPDGTVERIADGIGVIQLGDGWKFFGDLLPIQLDARARAQRNLIYIDGVAQPVQYNRAFQFEVPAQPGLACALVSQHNPDGGGLVPLAYYKLYPGATERLSLWSSSASGNGISLDPAVGFLRSEDDTWRGIPDGDEGDTLIRNFYRGGRSVTFSLFSDDACSTAYTIDGKSSFDVDVSGVSPVASALPNLQWPEIDATLVSSLEALAIDSGATATLNATWSFPHGPLGIDEASVCGDRGECGKGGTGRLDNAHVQPGATGAVLQLTNSGPALVAGSAKTFMLSGRNGDGIGLESAYTVCSTAHITPTSPGQSGMFCQ